MMWPRAVLLAAVVLCALPSEGVEVNPSSSSSNSDLIGSLLGGVGNMDRGRATFVKPPTIRELTATSYWHHLELRTVRAEGLEAPGNHHRRRVDWDSPNLPNHWGLEVVDASGQQMCWLSFLDNLKHPYVRQECAPFGMFLGSKGNIGAPRLGFRLHNLNNAVFRTDQFADHETTLPMPLSPRGNGQMARAFTNRWGSRTRYGGTHTLTFPGTSIKIVIRFKLYEDNDAYMAKKKCTPNCTGFLCAKKPPDCEFYRSDAMSEWLPNAYAASASCACRGLPGDATYVSPQACCVRSSLYKAHMEAPTAMVAVMRRKKAEMCKGHFCDTGYGDFVRRAFIPFVYRIHVDAYRSCTCPSPVAQYRAWEALLLMDWKDVTQVIDKPLGVCTMVVNSVRLFGYCGCDSWLPGDVASTMPTSVASWMRAVGGHVQNGRSAFRRLTGTQTIGEMLANNNI